MCGIAGLLGYSDLQSTLGTMLRAQRHRGPDDEGIYVDNGVALGVRRLSIIDVEEGVQPRTCPGVICFFNGEIYNHEDIRRSNPHWPFKGRTDTEVLPHLWSKLGVSGLQKLNGMFAIAFWEPTLRKLTLIRDRLGVKPLWIWEHDGRVAFSSELRSFAAAGLQLNLDPTSLWDYLTHNYIPAPRSPFREVRLLPGGNLATIKEKNGRWTLEEQVWWTLPNRAMESPLPIDAVEEVRDLLEQSITRQLNADRPLGCLLSGGLDSSLLAAWACKIRGEPLKTFSVGYDNPRFDERGPAKKLATFLHCPHYSVQLTSDKFFHQLDQAVLRGDTLLADQAIVPLSLLYEIVTREVQVVLDGDGADEIFGGYPTFTADTAFKHLVKLPNKWRRGLELLSQRIPETKGKADSLFKLERFLRHATLGQKEAHALWRNIFPAYDKQALIRKEYHPLDEKELLGVSIWMNHIEKYSGGLEDAFDRADAAIWLADDNLKKVDGQSMGVGVEARVPYLDHCLVEKVLPWSRQLKRRYGVKGLMRESARGILPEFARNRSKAGFHLPLAGWLHGPLKEDVSFRLRALGEMAGEWIDVDYLEHRISTDSYDSYRIFNLLVLESWWRQWPQTLKI